MRPGARHTLCMHPHAARLLALGLGSALASLAVLGACREPKRVAGREAPAEASPASTPASAPASAPAYPAEPQAPTEAAPMPKPGPEGAAAEKVEKTAEQWRTELTPEQYRILREKGTERAFSGAYWDTKTAGTYHCAGCGAALFVSDAKFDSGCGWPSFFQPLEDARLVLSEDRSHGMARTEVCCRRCGGHLGHVFDDGPAPTGLRFCINSASIRLAPKPAPGGPAAPDQPGR